MHGYSRLGRSSTGSGSISPSPSPPSSPRFRRNKGSSGGGGGGFRGGGGGGVDVKLQSFVERWVYVVISAVYRRRGILLFAPLLYISAMLLYMGTMGFDVGMIRKGSESSTGKTAPVGSLYRSPQVFEHLWPYMEAENNRSNDLVICFLSICNTFVFNIFLFFAHGKCDPHENSHQFQNFHEK